MERSIVGLILAGGRSSRFGSDKATATLGGRPMIGWVAATLSAGTRRLAVSARLGSPAASYAAHTDLIYLPDPPGSADGPLSGVLEGLRWAAREGAEGLVTAPCDTPFLPAGYVRRLVEETGGNGAVVVTPDGLEPLCALWPISALAEMEGLAGHPSIRRVLAQLGAVQVLFPDARDFQNLNTPEDFAIAERRMAERGRPRSTSPSR